MNGLDQPATRRDLAVVRGDIDGLRRDFAVMRGDVDGLRCDVQVLRDDMNTRFEQVDARFAEMNVRFDQMTGLFDQQRQRVEILVESFKSEFANLYDWVHGTSTSADTRLDRLEQDHGARLLSLETRTTRLERRRK